MLRRLIFGMVPVLFVFGADEGTAQVPLLTASGVVEKASKESITVQPRGAGGKFEPTLVLRLVGTSRVTTLVPQKKDGKTVYTRREAEPKDLKAKQPITAIYAKGAGGTFILMTAVVQPVPEAK